MKFLTPIALILAVVAVAFMFIKPHYAAIGTVKTQIANYDDAIEKAKAVVTKRDELVAKKDGLNQDADGMSRLKKLLPDANDDIRLIIDTNNLVSQFGSKLKDVKVVTADRAGIASDKTFGTSVITFGTSMTYEQFIKFLAAEEKNLRINDVDSLTFSTPDKTNIYDFTLSLRTYWLK